MPGMKEIIHEAESLPVKERAAELDAEWAKVARRRLSELRTSNVKAVTGDVVFTKIRERFKK